ncbi:MAG: DUF3857 domain-containing protein [Cyclobacteriaceae bacterium]
MKVLVLLSSICFCVLTTNGQQRYNTNGTDPKFLEGANSIVQKNYMEFEVLSPGEAVLKVDYAITILNKGAESLARLRAFHDKFRTISNVKAFVYDKNGEQIRKVPKEDILDLSIISGFAFYDDNRIKYLNPDYKDYPYTFEYSYTARYSGLLTYPSWFVYSDYNQSVVHSEFSVVVPRNMSVRYLEQNGVLKPEVQSIDGKVVSTWKASNLVAIKEEPFSKGLYSYSPSVIIAPNEFEMEGIYSKNESWNDFAQWISSLNQDRDDLSEDKKEEIRELVKGVESDSEKVKILYNHLQNETRYVSIQLGIGGWQPFKASTVEELGYGDCKALSNYMKAMLDVVGINSNYVLVSAGANQPNIKKDFPGNQFNHAFIMVPSAKDTIWLECTSQQTPFGYLGSFTDDRDVLIINEDGTGNIVRTPAYSPEENLQKRNVMIKIDEEGNATADVFTSFTGAKYFEVLPYLLYGGDKAQSALYQSIELQNFTINEFDHESKANDEIVRQMNLSVSGYARKSGTNLIMPLNFANSQVGIKSNDVRTNEIQVRRASTEIDDIVYEIPVGYHIANQPSPVTIDSQYGKYEMTVEIEGRSIKYHRKFTMHRGLYPATEYESFENFMNSIKKADRQKMLLKYGT